ncbi:substrate-binding periplasmic protein [Aestuariispira insulae]|uniref:substrate-binding periplasmic protein n=1 Tax=Aestuariispira insulae TaxID=1461337 RepID=UPI001C3F8DE7|nr:transporter substrate-binding domain-containing protein [Aestuariispira insulae]
MAYQLAWADDASLGKRYLFVGTHFAEILEANPGGQPQGLAVEVLDLIEQRTGDRFLVSILPWKRALTLVQKGNAHALIGPYKTPEREAFLNYTQNHFYEDRMVFIARAREAFDWRGDFQAVQGKKIITIRGWAYGQRFEDNLDLMKPHVTNDIFLAMQMLLNRRGDLIAGNERNAMEAIQQSFADEKVIFLDPPFCLMQGYFAFSKANAEPEMQDRFNRALADIVTTGQLFRLWQKHGLTHAVLQTD